MEKMEKIDLQKTATTREQILAALVMLSLFVMFFRVIYFPKKEATQQLKSQIQNMKLEKEALAKFTRALREAKQKALPLPGMEPISRQMQVLKGEIQPVATTTATLLAHITTPLFLKGVRVKGMSDIPPKKEAGFEKADFFLNIQGSFRNIIGYIGEIEKLPALLLTDNIALKAVNPKATLVDTELNGTIYALETKNGK